jgi:hypothetical protein
MEVSRQWAMEMRVSIVSNEIMFPECMRCKVSSSGNGSGQMGQEWHWCRRRYYIFILKRGSDLLLKGTRSIEGADSASDRIS